MIIQRQRLDFVWPTLDPFLFCVHHRDFFPKANGQLGPAASLAGRNIGQDFVIKDGWRMYHGQKVPGFPAHPHRGFETVTVVPQGWVDHADSLGGKGRYGFGDVQWMTAGSGIQHSEMFPLLSTEEDNPMELFQIWLNLASKDKMAPPFYKMLWHNEIPIEQTNGAKVTWYAHNLSEPTKQPPSPPPHSWAHDANNEVAIATIELAANQSYTLPASHNEINRCLYFYDGEQSALSSHNNNETERLKQHQMLQVHSTQAITLTAGDTPVKWLLLQGKPIGEPVAHHGPFVMNTPQELQQAFMDYQRTQFGGWPFASSEPVNGHQAERFAEMGKAKP